VQTSTALQNYFVEEETNVYAMRVGGTGEPEKLADSVTPDCDAVQNGVHQ
jgi:hypothetical protein